MSVRKGAAFGFVGSSDTHRLVPGLGGAAAGIYVKEFTPEAVCEAYKNRRLIASQGAFVFCDFRVGDLFIGERGESDGPPTIRCRVETEDDPIEQVWVLRDGEAIHEGRPDAPHCEFGFRDDSVGDGEHFYFVKIKLAGATSFNFDPAENALAPFTKESDYPHNLAKARGAFVWTSPIWVRVK